MVLHSWGHAIKYCIGTERNLFMSTYEKREREKERKREGKWERERESKVEINNMVKETDIQCDKPHFSNENIIYLNVNDIPAKYFSDTQ
jgi:hypothetical protein